MGTARFLLQGNFNFYIGTKNKQTKIILIGKFIIGLLSLALLNNALVLGAGQLFYEHNDFHFIHDDSAGEILMFVKENENSKVCFKFQFKCVQLILFS